MSHDLRAFCSKDPATIRCTWLHMPTPASAGLPPSLQAAAPPKRSSSMLSGKCDTPDKANPWKLTRFVIWRPAHDTSMAASGYGHPKPQRRRPRGARSSGKVTSRSLCRGEAYTKHFHSVPFPFLWRLFYCDFCVHSSKLGLVYAVFMNLTLVMIVNCAFLGATQNYEWGQSVPVTQDVQMRAASVPKSVECGRTEWGIILWLYCGGFSYSLLFVQLSSIIW